jgi:hypothetical protein
MVLTLRRSSIKGVSPSEAVCYTCEEIGMCVAGDVAVGGFICEECIGHALKTEILIMATWGTARMRHPEPEEFPDWENH